MKPKVLTDARGVTLVELMIVLVLSGVLMLAVYLSYQSQQRTGLGQYRVAAMQQDLRAVSDVIESDIRSAGRSFAVQAGATEGILNGSGAPALLVRSLNADGSANDVSYRLNGNSLERNGAVLISSCRALSFRYFDVAGGEIVPSESGSLLSEAQRALVRSIRLSLEVQTDKVDPDTGQHLTRTFVRNVRCRNLEINRGQS